MGSLFSSISGLRNHSTWMNVIGNNISNVNTVGYKSQRITFKEAISQSLSPASGANLRNNLGGVNAIQSGLGAALGSIDTIMSQGALQTTGRATDIAIDGKGFFIVKKGDQTLYTRAGNFYFDNQGNLVTSDGGLVQGWSLKIDRQIGPPFTITYPTEVDTKGPYGNIQIPQNLVLGPKQTSNSNVSIAGPTNKEEGIILKGNLDAMTPLNPIIAGGGTPPGPALPPVGYTPDAVNSAIVYDSLGVAHTIIFYWTQTGDPTNVLGAGATPSNWAWTAYDVTGGRVIDINAPVANQAIVVGSGTDVTFNPDGSLAWNGVSTAANPINPTLTITPIGNGAVDPLIVSVNFGTDNNMAPGGIGLRDGITGDYGNGTFDPILNQYIPKQTIYTAFVDGYSEGTLISVSVDKTGGLNCTFSNNQTITIAKLALANFANPEGLIRAGDTMFLESANSGKPQVSTAGNAGLGTTTGGTLEASNVDLSVELTNMIIAQRGFESNARIITTSADMLNTLVNLGR